MSERSDIEVGLQAAVFLLALPLTNFKAHLSLQQPTRVAVLVRGHSEYITEPAPVIIRHVLSILGIPGTETLYLACEDWGRTIHFVFDIFHASYDFDTAHVIHDITVFVVSLGRTEGRWFAQPSLKEQVNKDIAQIHCSNGWEERPPFYATHARGAVPIYDNPRITKTLPANEDEADIRSEY